MGEEAKKRKLEPVDAEIDERKRKYNSGRDCDVEVTPEEMEAYQRGQFHFEDPMRAFADAEDEDAAAAGGGR
eukprot:NODE_6510_length_450_cov_30.329177_g4956_i0.p5 GENE.NODE_6510_length_450_cov_30.329177_g4956_i0~~NODE_6510_length_450_cov_30.329177_g4956_i0.p5  ORF type:complete len:80 (-),score=47.31 NODE_6510_length_450_cov_30.329177_g4956_i0:210-425(-)